MSHLFPSSTFTTSVFACCSMLRIHDRMFWKVFSSCTAAANYDTPRLCIQASCTGALPSHRRPAGFPWLHGSMLHSSTSTRKSYRKAAAETLEMHAAQPHYRNQVPMLSILALRHCTSRGVLTLCDCAKPLLARSIPDLKLDLLAIKLNSSDLEIDPYENINEKCSHFEIF